LDYYIEVLSNHSLTLPIWLTEFGSYTDDEVTEVAQASWHVKNFSFAAARNVDKIFIDVFGGGDSLGQSAMLYRAADTDPWTARLLFYTQKLMNSKLASFTDCEELVYGEQYRFTVGAESVYVLWGDDALPSELVDEVLTVVDIYGHTTYTDSLVLTTEPVFVTVDDTQPTVSLTVPTFSTDEGRTGDITIAWAGSDTNGVASYDVSYRQAGKSKWTTWLTDTSKNSKTFHGKIGKRYQFRARASDYSNNQSAYAEATVIVPFDDRTLTYDEQWKTLKKKSAYRTTLHQSTVAQAQTSVTDTFKVFYLIAPKGKGYGKVRVAIDGKTIKTVNLKHSKALSRQLVFSKQFSKRAKRVVTFTAKTAKPVALDAWFAY
ncbi:MAG: fibronectin type III domain-containing protein, partial [Candidatus Kerfeldbacteria bacterium]|nr:fibronectin type III domain-containing protein [Candidatus Kerfeldbacteria bacterium]